MSDFWSVYIIAIVVLNLVGCAFLLFANLRMTPEETRSDTTGHSFDGIQERNQPLPRWSPSTTSHTAAITLAARRCSTRVGRRLPTSTRRATALALAEIAAH